MYLYKKIVHLKETDATGVIYFSELANFALEAFEDCLLTKGFSLSQMIQEADFLLPIVHMKADYSAPLRVGDAIEIHLDLKGVGDRSFTLEAEIKKDKTDAGKVCLVHVMVSKATGRSVSIPDPFIKFLRSCFS